MQRTLCLNEHDGLKHVKAATNMFMINIEIYEASGLTRNPPLATQTQRPKTTPGSR